MIKDSRYWSSKSTSLHNVVLSRIVELQTEINSSSTKDVIASQVFLINYDSATKISRYDAIVYFKDKHGDVKGL
tara:strand:+ start:1767 stop:1988 length:222 start_codon:yes stop_codon:yes gene_type:complete